MTENTDAGSCGALEQIMQRQICFGADKPHMEMAPDFSGKGERAIFTDSCERTFSTKHPRIKMQL